MAYPCPECGAILSEGVTCQDLFDSFLVLEFSDPGYGEVHMLTVACYMIQHGRYSDEGLAWIESKLRAYLEEGVGVAEIRRRAAQETGQSKRTWRVARPPDAPPRRKIAWSMTIADVATQYRDARSYCELVRQWARATLREIKPLLSA